MNTHPNDRKVRKNQMEPINPQTRAMMWILSTIGLLVLIAWIAASVWNNETSDSAINSITKDSTGETTNTDDSH